MFVFVYKISTLAFFFAVSENDRKGRRGEIFPALGNIGTFLIRWSQSWHTSWKAGRIQFFCQGWALRYPWEKLPTFGKFTGLWKMAPCTLSAVAPVDTDAAAPVCGCLRCICWGWARPTCCCWGLLGGCGDLSSTNTPCVSCCCPSSVGKRERLD